MDCVAFETAAIDAYPTRSRWDASAAELVQTMLDRWHLEPGEAFVGGEAASVLGVTTSDGRAAVLKVGFPHPEAVGEAIALEAWGAELCPRVLRQDPWTWSLLLERVEPGIPLSKGDLDAERALDAASSVFSRLISVHIPGGVPTLNEIVGDYLASARSRLDSQRDAFDALGVTETIAEALDDAAALVESDAGESFLHGDYNPGNLLLDSSGAAERYVVIDPKPMRGDREFDLWPLVEQIGSPWSRRDPTDAIESQMRRVVERTGSDYSRAVRWAHVRAAFNVSWFIDDGNPEAAMAAARQLRTTYRIRSA